MKSTEISYSEDEDFEENDSYDMTLDELLEHLSIPLGGSPLVRRTYRLLCHSRTVGTG